MSNITGRKQEGPQEIKDNLARQLIRRTLWEDSVKMMVSSGVDTFLEIGPGKTLTGLVRRINPQLKVYNIGTVEELEEFKQEYEYVVKG